MTEEKNILTVLTSGFLAFFAPIAGNVFAMAWVFIFNFLVGLIVGLIIQGEKFDHKKAFRCIGEAAVFFILAASIYVCGRANGAMEAAIQCVSTFVYIILFFYGRNVLKNLRMLLKEGTTPWYVIDFVYNIISFEFVKSIPGLTKYVNDHESVK